MNDFDELFTWCDGWNQFILIGMKVKIYVLEMKLFSSSWFFLFLSNYSWICNIKFHFIFCHSYHTVLIFLAVFWEQLQNTEPLRSTSSACFEELGWTLWLNDKLISGPVFCCSTVFETSKGVLMGKPMPWIQKYMYSTSSRLGGLIHLLKRSSKNGCSCRQWQTFWKPETKTSSVI